MIRTVVYVPIDDRPCNLDRVVMAATAMGIDLLVPPINLMKTCLDNQPLNSTGLQHGDPEGICSWIEDLNSKRVWIDGFIVSVDQITSGGLVNSRTTDGTGNDISLEMTRINRILSAIGTKPAYFFDTLTRLASTVGYKGMTSVDYTATRNYFSLPRQEVINSFDEIINRYHIGADGNVITNTFGLTQAKIDICIANRKRKFRLNVAIADLLKGYPNIYHTISVDDGANYDTVQKNEIVYLENNVTGLNSIFGGIDEIGMCMLSRFAVDQYSPWKLGRKPKIKVNYYGGGENLRAEEYDYRSLDFVVNKHIEVCGGQRVTTGQDIDLLVLTQPNNGKTVAQNAADLHYKINTNNTGNIPTIVMDCSLQMHELQRRLYGLVGATNTTKLLAYSGWNTVSNTAGLALGHGIGRFAMLTSGVSYWSRECLTGQIKLLFTELVKDVSYKMNAVGYVAEYLRNNVDDPYNNPLNLTAAQKNEIPYNFYKYDVDQANTWKWGTNCLLWASFVGMTSGEFSIHNIAKVFWTEGTNHAYEMFISPSSCQIARVNWINYPYEDGTSSWFKLQYPWHRTFECKFPLNVSFK